MRLGVGRGVALIDRGERRLVVAGEDTTLGAQGSRAVARKRAARQRDVRLGRADDVDRHRGVDDRDLRTYSLKRNPIVACSFCDFGMEMLPGPTKSDLRRGDDVMMSSTSPSTPKRLLHHHTTPAPAAPPIRLRVPSNGVAAAGVDVCLM